MWQAFHHLRSARVSAMSMGAIPVSAVLDYAERFAGITCPVSKYRLVSIVTQLDNAERAEHGRATA